MNRAMMCQYIEFVADRLMIALGHDKIFDETNPFEWMESISLQGKGNFFETRESSYQKAGVMSSLDKGVSAHTFTTSEDF